jgi:transcriptional regulator with XRE-family HTH domain
MARTTLKACPAGMQQAETARIGKGWSQDDLATKVGTTRQPVGNFLSGKNVDAKVFVAICTALELDWEVISGQKQAPAPIPTSDLAALDSAALDLADLEALVEQARAQVQPYIEQRCGWMRVLDMRQPIGLGAIYTDVNILEKITGKTRRDLEELRQGGTAENFDRFLLGTVRERRVDGLQAVRNQRP